MEDHQAVAALTSRDPGTMHELVAAYGDRLLRSACLLCGDPSEAQDLVQETFLQAFRSAGRFEGRSGVYTWLHGILLNLTRHYHRKRVRLVYHDELPAAGEPIAEPPASQQDRDAGTAALMAALQQLSGPHREVLVLRYYENLKINEIAVQTGASPGTVKSRLYYALDQMQKMLPAEMNLFGGSGTD